MAITMQELERRRPVLERALDAREKLSRLRNSESWRQRYFSGDPDAVAEYDRLVATHAAGTAVAREVKFGATDPGSSEARLDADALLKHQEQIDGMTADPDFVQRYAEGDVAAVRAFNQASIGGAEHLSGATVDKVGANKDGSV